MARIDNLTNYLTDVAAAIKTKKGSQVNIPAANFDIEISNLPSGGTYQTKSINITNNGLMNVTPDQGYDAIAVLNITTNVPTGQMKEYSSVTAMNNDIANISEGEVVKVTENGITTFYLKETTMKKLIKEEDTISPEEYVEDVGLTEDILGGEPVPPEPEIQDHYEIEYTEMD